MLLCQSILTFQVLGLKKIIFALRIKRLVQNLRPFTFCFKRARGLALVFKFIKACLPHLKRNSIKLFEFQDESQNLMSIKKFTKLRVFYFVFSLFAALLLSGCSFDFTSAPSVIDSGDYADFVIGKLTAPEGLKSVVVNKKGGLPESFTLNLKACATYKDRSDAPVARALFVIQYETNFQIQKGKRNKVEPVERYVRSDDKGCIEWEEEYGWKWVKRPVWIGLNRRISTKNNAIPGRVDIKVAVNPYLGESDQDKAPLLDQRYSDNRVFTEQGLYEKKGLIFLTTQESSKENWPQLWVPNIERNFKRFTDSDRPKILLPEPLSEEAAPEQKESFNARVERALSQYKECKSPTDSFCYKRDLELDIKIPLKLRIYNTQGDILDIPLNGGQYNIKIQLIFDSGLRRRLHEKICIFENQSLRMGSGGGQTTRFFNLKCLMKIPYFISWAYKLLIEIEPEESANLPFKRFQGIYSFDQLNYTTSKPLVIDTDIDNQYQSVLDSNEEIDIFSDMNIQDIYSLTDDKDSINRSFFTPFLDANNEFKMTHVGSRPNIQDKMTHVGSRSNIQDKMTKDEINKECQRLESPVIRTVSFRGDINLKDKLQTGDLSQIPFRVFIQTENQFKEYVDEDGKSPLTDSQGDIQILVSLEHKIYDRQKYFRVIIHFISEGFGLYGQAVALLNPWQRAFQAHQDGTALSRDAIREDTSGITNPKLVINQFKSVNLFPSFGLDKFLNFNLYHKINFLFQPFIIRHDDVSFGLNHRARSLLRDGYYMARMMLLRNPQETLKLPRVYRDLSRVNILNNWQANFNPENLDYFTHTDMIVKAEANFMNVYMPLYISNRQFYYIASRNLISIQVAPVDPKHLKYKIEDDACQVDIKEMKAQDWRPFYDHELINHPYVGPFNIQNWTNWNIMSPAEDLDTDALIEKSRDGCKNKEFSFRKEEYLTETNDSQKSGCLRVNPPSSDSKSENGENPAPVDFIIRGACLVSQGDYPIDLEDEDNARGFLEFFAMRDINKGVNPKNIAEVDRIGQTAHQLLDQKNDGTSYRDLARQLLQEHPLPDGYTLHFPELGHDPASLKKPSHINPRSIQEQDTQDYNFNELNDFIESHEQYIQACGGGDDLDRIPDLAQKDAAQNEGEDILKSFADKNALRLVQLEGAEGARFIEDMARALEKSKSAPHLLDAGEILPDLTPKDQTRLAQRFQDECARDWLPSQIGEFLANMPWVEEAWFQDKLCRHDILKSYIEELTETIDLRIELAQLYSLLSKIRRTETWKKLQQSEFALTEETLTEAINDRSLTQEPGGAPALALARSLCHFWFDSYLPDYLQEDQQLSAYTDYATKFDLYQVLESDEQNSFETGIDLLGGFMTAIGLSKSADSPPYELINCHERYSACIVRDHCRLNSLNDETEYCKRYQTLGFGDNSCRHVLKKECAKDKRFHPLCKELCNQYDTLDHIVSCGVKEGQCHTDLNAFCRTNPDHEVCYKLSNRCIVNYRSCLQSEGLSNIFQGAEALKKECLIGGVEYERLKFMQQAPRATLMLDDLIFGEEGEGIMEKCGSVENPLQTCLENPYRFFKFESKMAVHELSNEDSIYKGGYSFNLNLSGGFALGSYMNWGAQSQTTLTLSSKFEVENLWSNGLTKFFPSLSLGKSMRADAGNSARRGVNVASGENIYYVVEKSAIELKAVKFQKCLVVKPRPNAFFARYIADENWIENNVFEEFDGIWSESAEKANFKKYAVSRPGLLICNPVEERAEEYAETFEENYYYISQDTRAVNTVQFLNPFDLANRPFVHILRGRREFVKFYHLHKEIMGGDNGDIQQSGATESAHDNMFINYPHPVEEAVGLNLMLREFNETGFHPGIYDYPDNTDQELDILYTDEDKGLAEETLKFFDDVKLLPAPPPSQMPVPVQQYK